MKDLAIILFFLTASIALRGASYERFEENGKVGLKDNNGNIVLPASFEALGWSDGNFSMIGQITGYRQQNRWGLLNLKKEFITPAEFESLTSQGGDRVVVSKFINPYSIKFGCIDLQGKIVIPFSYDEITLHGLRAIVMVKNGARYDYGLIDLNDHTILLVQYRKIIPIGSLRYAVENFSGKTALCSEDGKWVTDFTIESISEFNFDLAIFYKDGRQGVIDRSGEIKVEPIYREIKIIAPNQLVVRKADEWEMIDAQYRSLQRIEADELIFDTHALSRIMLNGKTGLVDDSLHQRWPIDFEYISPIENQKVIVKKNGKYGLLRLDQSVVLPMEFDSLCTNGNFIRVLQRFAGKSSWELYDTFGIKKTDTRYELMGRFNGKFFPVKNRGYWGGVDRYGKEHIACVYDSLLEINDGLVAVRFKGQYGIITQEDQWRLMPQKYRVKLLDDDHFLEQQDNLLFLKNFKRDAIYFTDNPIKIYADHLVERLQDGTKKEINFQGQIVNRQEPLVIRSEHTFPESEGLIGIKRDGKFGFVDKRGRLRIANRYDDIKEFHDGIAPVKLVGKWGFINTEDQIVIQPTFETTEYFDHDVAQVSRKGKVGLINREGKVLLDLRYDSIKRLPNQLFLLTLHSLKGMADARGQVLIEPRFDYLEPVSNGLVIVSRERHYGVLTNEGVSIFPLEFDKLLYLADKNIFLAMKVSPWQTIDLGIGNR